LPGDKVPLKGEKKEGNWRNDQQWEGVGKEGEKKRKGQEAMNGGVKPKESCVEPKVWTKKVNCKRSNQSSAHQGTSGSVKKACPLCIFMCAESLCSQKDNGRGGSGKKKGKGHLHLKKREHRKKRREKKELDAGSSG